MVTPLAPQQLAGILPRQAVRLITMPANCCALPLEKIRACCLTRLPGRRLSAWQNWRLSACSGCRCNTWQGSGTFWG